MWVFADVLKSVATYDNWTATVVDAPAASMPNTSKAPGMICWRSTPFPNRSGARSGPTTPTTSYTTSLDLTGAKTDHARHFVFSILWPTGSTTKCSDALASNLA